MYGNIVFFVTFMKTCDFHVIIIDSLDEMEEAIMGLFPSNRFFFVFDTIAKILFDFIWVSSMQLNLN